MLRGRIFVIFLLFCMSSGVWAEPQIDGLERRMTKKIGNAEFSINNAGEITLSIGGKPLITKDGGNISMKAPEKKILYSSEWTKDPAVIDVREEKGSLNIEAVIEKTGVGRFVKKIVFRDGSLSVSEELKRNDKLKNCTCSYSIRLVPDLAATSFELTKNGELFKKPFPGKTGKIEWNIESGMSELAFLNTLVGNYIHIEFPANANSLPWRLDDFRAHSSSVMNGFVLRTEGCESLKAAFNVKWRKHLELAPNIFPGDTSFETGTGFWLPQCGWALDDSTAKDGKKSLRLEGPFFSTCVNGLLGSARVKLEKDTDYTFSVWMKGESEGQQVILRIMRGDWANVAKAVKLSTKWKRFSLTLPKDRMDKDPNLWHISLASNEMKKIWLDAVKLEKGSAPSDYVYSEAILCSLDSGVPSNIFLENEPLKFKLSLCNPSSEKRIFNIQWELKDIDSKVIASGSINEQLANFERKDEIIDLSGKVGRGYFKLCIFAGGGEKLFNREAYFAVVPEPRKTGKAFAGIRCSQSFQELSVLPRLGCRWVSLSEMAGWDRIEDEKGHYDPRSLLVNDDAVSLVHKLGLDVRFAIGRTPRWASTAPEKDPNYSNYPPADFSHLTEFARFMADRYKGKVQIWEILGESDLSWRGKQGWSDEQAAQNVADFTKAVSEGVRKSGSGARVSACGVSSGNALPFMEKVYEKCFEYVDDVDIHPYAGIRNIGPKGTWVTPEKNNLDGMLASVRDILGKYNSRTEYGVGELGYTLDVLSAPFSSFDMESAAILQRSFIISYAAGASRINWYCSYNNDEPLGYRYGIWRDAEGYQPLPAAAAFAWSAYVLDSSVLLSNKIWAQAVQATAFKQDDNAWLILWNRKNNKDIELEFTSGIDGLSAYNMFGTPSGTWKKNDKVKCIIGTVPIFFKCAASDIQALESSINSGTMHVPPLEIVPALASGKSVKVGLFNKVFAPVSGTLTLSVSNGWMLSDKSAVFKAVPINGKSELLFPLTHESGSFPDSLTVKADVVTDKGNKLSSSARIDIVWVPETAKKITLDGDLSEWPGKPLKLSQESIMPPDVLNAKIWKGEKDFSVNFYRAWDNENLYLAFEVFDDIHYLVDSGRLIYKGDCIQIGIDPKNDSAPGEEYNDGDFEFGLAMTPKGPQSYCWVPGPDALKSLRYAVKRYSGRTVYEAAIPWRTLAIPDISAGSIFKMGFVVFDKDGANEATRWMELCRGIAGGKNPSAFKYFILEK